MDDRRERLWRELLDAYYDSVVFDVNWLALLTDLRDFLRDEYGLDFFAVLVRDTDNPEELEYYYVSGGLEYDLPRMVVVAVLEDMKQGLVRSGSGHG